MPKRSANICEEIYLFLDTNTVKIGRSNVLDRIIIVEPVLTATKPTDGNIMARAQGFSLVQNNT